MNDINNKASAKQAKQTNPKPPKIDPLPDKIVSVDYSRRQLTSVPPQVWQSTDATILSTPPSPPHLPSPPARVCAACVRSI